jgi:type IV secretory pathway VirB10-like protein
VAHVLAGVLIIGTAISEIWLSLDAAGRYLFAIYGAAAAIAVLGFFAFYLSFVAELPPPPPKPIKAKKPKQRRIGGRKKGEGSEEAEEPADAEAETVEPEEAETPEPAEETPEPAAEAESATEEVPSAENTETAEPQGGLRNRRPTGKASHRLRRRSTRGTVAVDEQRGE